MDPTDITISLLYGKILRACIGIHREPSQICQMCNLWDLFPLAVLLWAGQIPTAPHPAFFHETRSGGGIVPQWTTLH